MKGNRHRFLTYLRNLRSGDLLLLLLLLVLLLLLLLLLLLFLKKSPDRSLLPARLSSLKKVDLWALD